MNLPDLIDHFSTDEKCRELLCRLRWPNGPECPRCKTKGADLETDKQLFYCKSCHYPFSVTTGTVFHDTHLPLEKWFLATLLLCEGKKGISACQIQRTLGVSYKTAWYLCHRIRAALRQTAPPLLDGQIEMDETYVGGKKHTPRRGKCSDKEVVIGIRQRNGDLRLFHAQDAQSGTLARYIRENISSDVELVITDELAAYPSALAGLRDRHRTVNHSTKVYATGDVHTNSIENAFSLLKCGITGTWHQISAKHLPAYLDEITFRFNRRHSKALFLDTLRHMVTAPSLPFASLTQKPTAPAP